MDITKIARVAEGRIGFTLLELLVALTLVIIISLIISQGNDAQKMYDTTISTVETYQKFPLRMDDINENLSKMIPTASLEFYNDRGRTRGYWDEGEDSELLRSKYGRGSSGRVRRGCNRL